MTSTENAARNGVDVADAVRHPRRREGRAGDRPVPVPGDQRLDQRHPQPLDDPGLLRRRAGGHDPRASRSPTTPTTRRCWSGSNHGPTPVEFLLHAIAACLTSGLANIAAARGVTLHRVPSTVEGDIDLLGILGLSDEVRNGYRQIRVRFEIEGDASPEELAALVEQSRRRSAVYDVLANGTDVLIDVSTPTDRLSAHGTGRGPYDRLGRRRRRRARRRRGHRAAARPGRPAGAGRRPRPPRHATPCPPMR